MADIPNPGPSSDAGSAAFISGAVQHDGDDIVVVPQPGVENPYVSNPGGVPVNDADANVSPEQDGPQD